MAQLKNFITVLIISIFETSSYASEPIIKTYTESNSSGNNLAVGYPVPIPANSLTPFDGFRSYQSLLAYHQDLALNNSYVRFNNIGQSHAGETIWAYTLSDPDSNTKEAYVKEAAVLIDGGLHSREWQTPETVSATLERLALNANDKSLNQYLLENLNIIIPVVNVDGFIQTQKYTD